MHLIIIVTFGVFGGLWLFTSWSEWRKARRLAKLTRRGMEMLHPDPAKYPLHKVWQ